MFEIRATTTDDQIDAAISCLDMRAEAKERRDDARAVLAEQGDQKVLELHTIGNVVVLLSPTFGYALVNEISTGTGDSLIIDAGTCWDADSAALTWRTGGNA